GKLSLPAAVSGPAPAGQAPAGGAARTGYVAHSGHPARGVHHGRGVRRPRAAGAPGPRRQRTAGRYLLQLHLPGALRRRQPHRRHHGVCQRSNRAGAGPPGCGAGQPRPRSAGGRAHRGAARRPRRCRSAAQP
nr:hypothetical protein [Tanacetum cinerariifolium]